MINCHKDRADLGHDTELKSLQNYLEILNVSQQKTKGDSENSFPLKQTYRWRR